MTTRGNLCFLSPHAEVLRANTRKGMAPSYLPTTQVERKKTLDEIDKVSVIPECECVQVIAALHMLSVFVSEETRLLVQSGIDNLRSMPRLRNFEKSELPGLL